jgi:predicted molibdopterin-dependent oxidoreductase YjgC
LTVDGVPITAEEGQSVAAALMASGRRAWRSTPRYAQPRGLFCGMGVCFDCLVEIDGRANLRACRTLALPGMRVKTQKALGTWEVPG